MTHEQGRKITNNSPYCLLCLCFLSAALIWNYYKKPADENEALIVTI